MSIEPDFATEIYTEMKSKRTSLLSKKRTSMRGSMFFEKTPITNSSSDTKVNGKSDKDIEYYSGLEVDTRSNRQSMMSVRSTTSASETAPLLEHGTKLGKPINGIRYVKGSEQEKLAQLVWVTEEMAKVGFF